MIESSRHLITVFSSPGSKGQGVIVIPVRASSVSVMPRPSTIENKYSNIFFCKTNGPTVLKFYMEHDLTSRSQNCKIRACRVSKMITVTKNSENI